MKNLQPIDGTPEKRLYTSIIADYDLKKALCELIDNVIDNANNQKLNNTKIKIILDLDSQTIIIEDNSGGISDLRNVIAPGATSNNLKKELIGMFGVGSKRATVALAKNIIIKTRINGKNTQILKYDEDWINSETWMITPQEADDDSEQIQHKNTIIELSNLRKNINEEGIEYLKKHFSQTYANFLKSNLLTLEINGEKISPIFFENWSYSPKYPPTKHEGELIIEDEKIKISITSGLSSKSSPTGEWGIYFYCNDRLIEKEIKNFEVGIARGLAGKPHASISLLKVFVSLNGTSSCMPWNSSKSGIDYSHQVFKLIQERLQEIVITYAKISRALEGDWDEELFKFNSGVIKRKKIDFKNPLRSNLPIIPPSRPSNISKIDEINKKITDKKPWTKGIVGGIQARELISKKEFLEKNRYILIVLDSTLEIAFKEFLVNDSGNYYSDKQLLNHFSQRHLVYDEIKKFPKGKKITNNEWQKIKYYNDKRNQIIHKRAAIDLIDDEINDYYNITKSIIKKLFNLDFNL